MKIQTLASLLLVAACGSAAPPPAAPAEPPPSPPPASGHLEPAEPAVQTVAPKAAIGAWGFDTAGMDTTVSPGDSFNNYANGAWLRTTKIPADKSTYGMFDKLSDEAELHTKEIIVAAKGDPGSEDRKLADLWASFMDEDAVERAGLTPIQPELDRIAAIKDRGALVDELAWNSRHQLTSPLVAGIGPDDKDPTHYLAQLVQGGLGLWDRDMYDPKIAQFAALRDGYKKYLETLLGFTGIKDAAARARAVYALEEKIAKAHWSKIENRDPVKTYNKMTPAQLAKTAPGVDWARWLKGTGFAAVAALDIGQPSAVAGIAKLVANQPLAVWKDYLTIHAVGSAAPELARRFVDTDFALRKLEGGAEEQRPRWKRGVDLVSGAMGEAIGKKYVALYFPPQTKAHADQLVHNLLVAMGQRIDQLDWMGAETKAKAKAKLAAYNPKIGYPKQFRDYEKLEVVAGDPAGNVLRAAAFDYDRRLARIDGPVDRDEWGMFPMTVNAYYNPLLNEIVFPAAILQPPFFDANADDAVNYGGIGAVIGHEISHGFDDQGSQYDSTGALANWWTKDDRARFQAATAKLVAQYDAYCPFPAANGKPAMCVKGELTLGENIADLAGLTVAHTAYQISLGNQPGRELGGFTSEQRFFLGFAQIWRELWHDEILASVLVGDPHSPPQYRVSVVRNLDFWYDAFKPTGGALVLAPDQRVRIW